MLKLNIRRLVITESTGKLAGIVTQTQMMRMLDSTEMYHVMEQMQETIDQQTADLQRLNHNLQIANTELEFLSSTDYLTQIVNRRQLNKILEYEWERLAILSKPLSLIMCDVDHFKSYNDTYGHLAGDECLIKIAKALRKATRQTSDLVSRYGGEEFVVVLPDTNINGAERVANNIINHIKDMKIPHISSNISDYVTISLGVATVIPIQGSSSDVLLQAADQLLYQSKQQGRNTYSLKLLEVNATEIS